MKSNLKLQLNRLLLIFSLLTIIVSCKEIPDDYVTVDVGTFRLTESTKDSVSYIMNPKNIIFIDSSQNEFIAKVNVTTYGTTFYQERVQYENSFDFYDLRYCAENFGADYRIFELNEQFLLQLSVQPKFIAPDKFLLNESITLLKNSISRTVYLVVDGNNPNDNSSTKLDSITLNGKLFRNVYTNQLPPTLIPKTETIYYLTIEDGLIGFKQPGTGITYVRK